MYGNQCRNSVTGNSKLLCCTLYLKLYNKTKAAHFWLHIFILTKAKTVCVIFLIYCNITIRLKSPSLHWWWLFNRVEISPVHHLSEFTVTVCFFWFMFNSYISQICHINMYVPDMGVGGMVVSAHTFHLCDLGSIPAWSNYTIKTLHLGRMLPVWLYFPPVITLDQWRMALTGHLRRTV